MRNILFCSMSPLNVWRQEATNTHVYNADLIQVLPLTSECLTAGSNKHTCTMQTSSKCSLSPLNVWRQEATNTHVYNTDLIQALPLTSECLTAGSNKHTCTMQTSSKCSLSSLNVWRQEATNTHVYNTDLIQALPLTSECLTAGSNKHVYNADLIQVLPLTSGHLIVPSETWPACRFSWRAWRTHGGCPGWSPCPGSWQCCYVAPWKSSLSWQWWCLHPRSRSPDLRSDWGKIDRRSDHQTLNVHGEKSTGVQITRP